MDRAKYKQPVTAVSSMNGVVQVIHPDTGEVVAYAVRGLRKYSKEHTYEYQQLVASGAVDPRAVSLKELPNDWDVEFEDTEIMGKCRTSIGQLVNDVKKALRAARTGGGVQGTPREGRTQTNQKK